LAVEEARVYGGGEGAFVFGVEVALNGARGAVVCPDIFDAGFVECEIGFAEGEGVGREERLVGGSFGEVEGRGKGGNWTIDFAEVTGNVRW